MIKSVVVTNYLGESIVIRLRDTEPKHGLLISSITGLGPTETTINTTELATADGGFYNSSRSAMRNIVFTFKFDDYYNSIETVRQITYKYFPHKKPLILTFFTDNRMLYTTGYVETNEPEIFSDSEGCQISIICPSAYFIKVVDDSPIGNIYKGPYKVYQSLDEDIELDTDGKILIDDIVIYPIIVAKALNDADGYTLDIKSGVTVYPEEDQENEQNITSIESLFEFPFENDSLTENLIEFGNVNKNDLVYKINYRGDVETGVVITMTTSGEVTGDITLLSETTDEVIVIHQSKIQTLLSDKGGKFKPGDKLIVDTTRGVKTITLIRNGITYNVLGATDRNAGWIQLVKGENELYFRVTSGIEHMVFEVKYDTLFIGL